MSDPLLIEALCRDECVTRNMDPDEPWMHKGDRLYRNWEMFADKAASYARLWNICWRMNGGRRG